MMRSLRVHQYIDFLGARSVDVDVTKMIVRYGTLRAIAVLVLLASVSLSESVKLRKPRKRTTTRTPYQQSRIGPVIIRVMHKYTDDGLARRASAGCTNDNCRNARDKFHLDVNEAVSEEDNFLSDEESLRYVVHPEKYEHFVLRKNTGHASRYKRDTALQSSNASDHAAIDHGGDASKVSENVNKRNFTRVPLYKIDRYARDLSKPLSEASRTRRSYALDYSSRNGSDYYAQRKAVMDRYHARQREINARYSNRTNVIPRLEYNDVSQRRPVVTSNATLFNLERIYPSKETTARNFSPSSATFRYPSTKIDPIYSNESRYSRIPLELDSRRNIVNLGFKPDADLSQTRSSGNAERNALDFFVTPTPCTNLSLSGTFASKTRSKIHAKNCTDQTERNTENCDSSTDNHSNTRNIQEWGKCEGKIVYQHNLLLGLTGLPSYLQALFEVIIQGPVCITCVQTLRYNETRAIVTLDSGGRGHEYAKLKLQGYENEGFSYIIKIWGVTKTGQVCDK